MDDLERRAAEAEALVKKLEARVIELEKGGVVQAAAAAAGDGEVKRKKEVEELSDIEKANYRIKFLTRGIDERDKLLKESEENLAKRDYQILHLRRALDRYVAAETKKK